MSRATARGPTVHRARPTASAFVVFGLLQLVNPALAQIPKKKLSLKPGSADPNGGTGEGNDPEHRFLIQSSADLPGRLELEAVFRFVDARPDLELAVVGQNLLDGEHIEFNSSPLPLEVQRGVYGRVTWR